MYLLFIQSVSYILVLGVSIYIYIHTYIYYITEVNYAINRIHEKAFRSALSIQIKKTFPLTNYLLRITFSRYLFVLVALMALWFIFPMMAFMLLVKVLLHFELFFKRN